jgi:hypothetical protein
MVATYTGRTDGRIARAQASRVQFTDPSNLVTRREYPRVLINLGRNSMSTADPLSHGGDPHVSLDSKCEIGMASLTVAGCRVNAGGRFLSKKKRWRKVEDRSASSPSLIATEPGESFPTSGDTKGVFGSPGDLSHLIHAERSYVDYIQICFCSVCLVGRVR